MLKAGFPAEDIPRILETYLFCSPSLDGNFRCLPKAGGYYDQDHIDMLGFKVIEERIADYQRRQSKREKDEQKNA